MKKYIISLILLIATGLSPYITFAQTTEQNQNNACVNKVNGQDCTYDEQNPGMPPFTEDKEGKCDRRGDGRLYCNPDKTGWEDCFNKSLAGDACKTGGTTGGIAQLGTCKAQGSTFFCDTNNPPNTSPVTCGTTTCAAGEVCVNQGTTPTCTANAAGSDGKCGTATCTGGQVCVSQSGTPTCTASAATGGGTFVPPSNAPSTTAGNVSYESYTNFPGVGRIRDLCQLINALWLLGFVVLLTSVLGMFLYGGYLYVTAGVNAGKVNQAKEIFTNTITGLIIGLSIFIVINIINPGLLQGNCSIPSAGSGTPSTPSTPGGGGGDIPARIASAANSYRGTSTAAGPGGGNLACAWAVNNIISNAGLSKIGSNTNYVPDVETALRGGRGRLISQSESVAGDIVIEGGNQEHMGICLNQGCSRVISNSSSRASFIWESGFNFDDQYGGATSRVYRVLN